MKNTTKFLVFILFAMSLFSCSKLLDQKPLSDGIAVQNQSSDSILYKSANEAEAALAGVYADFNNEYFQLDYFILGDAQADNSYSGADNPAFLQIDDYVIDATNVIISRDWAYLYTTIGKANTVINNVNTVTDPLLTPNRKKQIIAEASFIRAYAYFIVVQIYADAPLQLTEIKTISAELLPELYPIMFPPRAPMAEIYAQIIKDLETALSDVPITALNKNYITRGAVNGMLAKVYATIEPHDWNKVLKYCNDVIAGPYSLLPQFDQLWDDAHENSSESIFEINYEGTPSSGNWGNAMFRGMDWKKFNIPSNDLVAAYEAENDNIRKNSSIIFLDVSGKWSDSHWPQNNYPFVNKYRKYQYPSSGNFIFLRLADILLLKAEALNESGDIAGAKALVNQIRNRVNLPDTPASDQAAMRLAIEKERRLELAFEGHRWWDLKRTGRAIDVMNAVTNFGGVSQKYHLTQERLLWPVPQTEIDKNVNLVQNPGY